jgi:hypothetical protein
MHIYVICTRKIWFYTSNATPLKSNLPLCWVRERLSLMIILELSPTFNGLEGSLSFLAYRSKLSTTVQHASRVPTEDHSISLLDHR